MKKKLFGVLSIVLLCFASAGFDVKKNEDRLPHTSGKERIEILVELTKHYREREPKKALAHGGEARKLLEDSPDPFRQTDLLNHLSTAHTTLGNYNEARKYADEALELAGSTGNEKGTADALVNSASIYKKKDLYDRSNHELSRAKDIYEKLGDRERVATAFNLMGINYRSLGDYTDALDCYLKSSKIMEELGDKHGLALRYNNIGNIYSKLGDQDSALVYFKKALAVFEETGDKRGIGISLHNLAFIHIRRGKFAEAMPYAKRSLKIKEEAGDRRGIAITLSVFGMIYEDQKSYPRALHYFNKSLAIAKELDHRGYIAGNLLHIGTIKRKTGQYNDALLLLKQSMNISAEIKAVDDERDAVKELAEAYAAKKDFRNAFEYFKRYKELNDSIFNDKNSKTIAELQTRYDSRKKELELMKKNEQIHHLNLARQTLFIKSLIVISLLVVFSTLLIYARYRLKAQAHRLLEKEIHEHKKTARELLRSHKMESLGILAGGIAHDFNNLLGVILGFLTMIKENVRNDTTTFDMVESVEEASEQAAVLSDKFRTLSQGKWFTIQKLGIEDILKSTAEHHPEVGHLLANISVPPGLKTFNGDKRRLREVLFNVLKNADEAMSEPKQVTLHAENMTIDEKNEFSLEKGDYVKITISDNGKGIPPEQLDRIFDPYFSTKDTPYQKGMGLGLAVCYAIIKQHNGHIAIKSQVGEGTTVDLYLPAEKEGVIRGKG